ncbi:MAG: hypothetical protein ISS76_21610 [Phycisphaerae bacterium]|nr:hypothetical protein [Phycisphaerae bacterium]
MNNQLNDEWFMDEEAIESMLKVAVGPIEQYPVCNKISATHAAGSAVTSFVTRAMAANISFLHDQVDVCCGEVSCERDFTDEKLQEHLDILLGLNLLLFHVTSDRRLGYSEEVQNLLTKAFAKLPQEILSSINEDIISMRHILEDEVLGGMMELIGKIWNDPRKDWEAEIKSHLQKKVLDKLWELCDLVDKIKPNVTLLMERTKNDWDIDVNKLWCTETCRPCSDSSE